MHEYSADVLDLMASAYDQACEKLLRLGGEVTRDIEFARSTLIDGIIEAVNRGVRSEDMLIAAALANLAAERTSHPGSPEAQCAPADLWTRLHDERPACDVIRFQSRARVAMRTSGSKKSRSR